MDCRLVCPRSVEKLCAKGGNILNRKSKNHWADASHLQLVARLHLSFRVLICFFGWSYLFSFQTSQSLDYVLPGIWNYGVVSFLVGLSSEPLICRATHTPKRFGIVEHKAPAVSRSLLSFSFLLWFVRSSFVLLGFCFLIDFELCTWSLHSVLCMVFCSYLGERWRFMKEKQYCRRSFICLQLLQRVAPSGGCVHMPAASTKLCLVSV